MIRSETVLQHHRKTQTLGCRFKRRTQCEQGEYFQENLKRKPTERDTHSGKDTSRTPKRQHQKRNSLWQTIVKTKNIE